MVIMGLMMISQNAFAAATTTESQNASLTIGPAGAMTESQNASLTIGPAGLGSRMVGAWALNVRALGSMNGRVLGYLYHGDKTMVLNKVNGWCQISFKDRNAFVYCRYLMNY